MKQSSDTGFKEALIPAPGITQISLYYCRGEIKCGIFLKSILQFISQKLTKFAEYICVVQLALKNFSEVCFCD